MRLALDTAAEGIFTVGPDARILEVNRTACERLEYTREELLRMSIPDIDPQFPRNEWSTHWESLRREKNVVLETEHVTKWGRRIPVEVSVSFFAKGGEEFVCSFIRDISAQRRSAEALRAANALLEQRVQERTQELRASEERLRSVIESAPLVMTSISANQTIDLLAGGALEAIGVRPQDFVGQPYETAWRDYPELVTAVKQTFAGQSTDVFVAEINRRQIEARCSPVLDTGGRICAVIVIWLDATERIRSIDALRDSESAHRDANRRLEGALQELREAQQQIIQRERLRALGELASGIAHDLNNTLMPIVAQSQLLEIADMSPAEQEEAHRLILSSAEQASAVVKRLQGLYKDDSSGHTVVPVDIVAVVSESVELTRSKWQDEAEQTGSVIHTEIDGPESLMVPGCAAELRQVFTNLIINAVNAIEGDGTIGFHIRRDAGTCRISVSDNGIGMNELERDRCFEPFFTTARQGQGMGLSVCRRIVEKHNGELSVDSRRDAGTTFEVRLPLATSDASGPEIATRTSAAGEGRFRVLYIDDDDVVRTSVVALLTALHVDVQAAVTGEAGVELQRAKPFDLVMTDLGMKGMSGSEVVQLMREEYPDTAVVVLSGWSRNDVLACFRDQGGLPDQILQKPVTLAVLRDLLASYGWTAGRLTQSSVAS